MRGAGGLVLVAGRWIFVEVYYNLYDITRGIEREDCRTLIHGY